MRRVAESFTWPFRAAATTWIWGSVMVLLWPLLFIPLLGYALEAMREATREAPAPPRFHWSRRLLVDGLWVAAALALSVLLFAVVLYPFANTLGGIAPNSLVAYAASFFLFFALPWGLLALLVLPHSTVAFARSGRPADLFNAAGAVRAVAREFAMWNAVVAAIVTAWAIGLACAGLLCVGIVPGVFYAILVSAHAAASLHTEASSQSPPTR